MKKYFLFVFFVFVFGAVVVWQKSIQTSEAEIPLKKVVNRPPTPIFRSRRFARTSDTPINLREAIIKGINLAAPTLTGAPKSNVKIFAVNGGVPRDIKWFERRFAVVNNGFFLQGSGIYDFDLPDKVVNSPATKRFYLKITDSDSRSLFPYTLHYINRIRARHNESEPWRDVIGRRFWGRATASDIKLRYDVPDMQPLIWVRGGRSLSTNEGWLEYTVLPYGGGQWSYDISPRLMGSINESPFRSPLRIEVGVPIKATASGPPPWPEENGSAVAPSGGWIADIQYAPTANGPWKHAPRRGEVGFPLHVYPGDQLWMRATNRDPKRNYPLLPKGKPQFLAKIGDATFNYYSNLYNRTPEELTVVNLTNLQGISWGKAKIIGTGAEATSADIVKLPLVPREGENNATQNFPRASKNMNDLLMVSINGTNSLETGIFIHSTDDVIRRSQQIRTWECFLETGGMTPTKVAANGLLQTLLNVRVNDVLLPLEKKVNYQYPRSFNGKREIADIPRTLRLAEGNTKLDVAGARVRIRAFDAQNRPVGQINGEGEADDTVVTSGNGPVPLEVVFTAPTAGDYILTAQVIDDAGQPLKNAPAYTLNLPIARPVVNVKTVISVTYGDWEAAPQPDTFQRSFWVLHQNETTPIGKTVPSSYAPINEAPLPITLTTGGPKALAAHSWLSVTKAQTANNPTWIRTTPETATGKQFFRYTPDAPISRQLRELEVLAKLAGNAQGGQQ